MEEGHPQALALEWVCLGLALGVELAAIGTELRHRVVLGLSFGPVVAG